MAQESGLMETVSSIMGGRTATRVIQVLMLSAFLITLYAFVLNHFSSRVVDFLSGSGKIIGATLSIAVLSKFLSIPLRRYGIQTSSVAVALCWLVDGAVFLLRDHAVHRIPMIASFIMPEATQESPLVTTQTLWLDDRAFAAICMTIAFGCLYKDRWDTPAWVNPLMCALAVIVLFTSFFAPIARNV